MSHVTDLKLKVYSLEALQLAAQQLGLELRRQSTYRWYGQFMGDYNIPADLKAHPELIGHCDYALTIPGNNQAYEVGVVAQPDGSYRLLWDFWNGGYGLEKAIGKDGCKLISEYEAWQIKMLNQANGAVGFEESMEGDVRVIDALYN